MKKEDAMRLSHATAERESTAFEAILPHNYWEFRSVAEPLRFTYLPWQNVEETEPYPGYPAYIRRGTGRWSKKPSVYGAFTAYEYGSVTTVETHGVEVIDYPKNTDVERIQQGVVCTPASGLIVMDVDDPEVYVSSPLGQVLPLDLAYTRRGRGGHIYIDARRYAGTSLWPTQGPVQGGDVKSAGYVAASGSQHYTGSNYERTGQPVLPGSDEIMTALCEAKRAAVRHQSVRRSSPDSGEREAGWGDDSRLAAAVYGWVFQDLKDDEIRLHWQEEAERIQCRGDWPFTDGDFQRHLRGARRKYEAHKLDLQQKRDEEERAQGVLKERLACLDKAHAVREEARRVAAFKQNLGNTAKNETRVTGVPHVLLEDPALLSGRGSIVDNDGEIRKILRYETDLPSLDWRGQPEERALGLEILQRRSDGEVVTRSDFCLVKRQTTLDRVLKDHDALFGETESGEIVVLRPRRGVPDDLAWRCDPCCCDHRLSQWPGLDPSIIGSCPLDTGLNVAHDREGLKHFAETHVRLSRERSTQASQEGRRVDPTRERLTGPKFVEAWNKSERGKYACLSVNKANRLLRKLAAERELLVRTHKPRNYLRNHQCRTASAVYALSSEVPDLVSPDPTVRERAEQQMRIKDDLEWYGFWTPRRVARTGERSRRERLRQAS